MTIRLHPILISTLLALSPTPSRAQDDDLERSVAAGGYPQLVTAFDDAVGFVEWSPDGAWLAFTLAPGGTMNDQVYLVRPTAWEPGA